MKKNAQWENWVNLVLGAWVFVMPWVISHTLPTMRTAGTRWNYTIFSAMAGAMWNFAIVGAIILVAAMMAIKQIKPWEEWTNMTAGFWLVLSPWMFGYAADSALMWNSVAVGLAVTTLSVLAVPKALRIQNRPS